MAMIESIAGESCSLEILEQRFEQWRSSRSTKREPIPQHLWQAASDLCNTHSINKVCRSLRLSYAELKMRVSSEKPATEFMQLDTSCFSGQWHLSCDRPDGSSLRLSGSGMMPAVDELLRRFFS
jgi:hypothetical protein